MQTMVEVLSCDLIKNSVWWKKEHKNIEFQDEALN